MRIDMKEGRKEKKAISAMKLKWQKLEGIGGKVQ